jgi:hypothetical protein
MIDRSTTSLSQGGQKRLKRTELLIYPFVDSAMQIKFHVIELAELEYCQCEQKLVSASCGAARGSCLSVPDEWFVTAVYIISAKVTSLSSITYYSRVL